MKKKKKNTLIFSSIFLVLVVIAYLAADRFLIRHVEIADVNEYSTAATLTTSIQTESAVENPVQVVSYSETTEETETTAEETAVESEPEVKSITYDDWNYQSSDIFISIQKTTSGSGSDTLTWFVADVIVSDATLLQNAFADDQFGQNIIKHTSQIAAENNALFAINGDYYGFREDGIIIRNGVIYRDDPTRVGLAFYVDGSMKTYDETTTSAEELLAEGVWNTWSFGPALLENGEIVDGITTVEVDHNFGNHSIQGNQPRSGVGIIDNNHFVFIVVDGRSKGYSRGATLTELAQMFKDQGCTTAYNNDGGGSATLYFMGRVVNNPLGKNKERGTSDILFVSKN